MTVAIHEPSNSLIVTAPEQLFREVEQLVKLIDIRNEKSIEVISPSNPLIVDALRQFLAGENASNGGTRSAPSRAGSSAPTPSRSQAPTRKPPVRETQRGR